MGTLPPKKKWAQKQKYRDKPTAFSKNSLAKGDRTKDSVAPDHTADHYSQTHIRKMQDGTYHAHDMTDGEELNEFASHGSSGYKHLPDGSYDENVTGNKRSTTKGGTTSTNHQTSDDKQRGFERGNVGHPDSQAGSQKTVNGDTDSFQSGTCCQSGGPKAGGFHPMEVRNTDVGLYNGKGGIGDSVSNGPTKLSWVRQEADGSYHIQIMPQGEDGGVATVLINPDGSIKITSESTMSIETKQAMSIKAPTLKIEAKVSIKGNMTQAGNFIQDGVHIDSNGTHA